MVSNYYNFPFSRCQHRSTHVVVCCHTLMPGKENYGKHLMQFSTFLASMWQHTLTDKEIIIIQYAAMDWCQERKLMVNISYIFQFSWRQHGNIHGVIYYHGLILDKENRSKYSIQFSIILVHVIVCFHSIFLAPTWQLTCGSMLPWIDARKRKLW